MSVQSTLFKKGMKQGKMNFLEKAWNNKTWALMNAAFAVEEYNTNRAEGKGRIHSTVDAGAQFVTYELLGGALIPLQIASALPKGAVMGIEKLDEMSRQMNLVNRNLPFVNSRFYDTRQGYTMRQQGMALAKNSRYQLEQTLMGNEAQYLKR